METAEGFNGKGAGNSLPWKLWIYTNYDCNISCKYCLARSTPLSPRHEIDVETVERLIDEAVSLGFECVYFTGGEPMLLDSIYQMLSYASARLPTTLLTNAMLAKGKRLEKLVAVANPNLVVQVSLDGGSPEAHDAYRVLGSWEKTVAGIRSLQAAGLRVRLSTTETPANKNKLIDLCNFHQSLGILEDDHFIRPLAKRGMSNEGMEVSQETLAPEITVNASGAYWHPLSTDEDMRLSGSTFSLARLVELLNEKTQNIHPLQTVM